MKMRKPLGPDGGQKQARAGAKEDDGVMRLVQQRPPGFARTGPPDSELTVTARGTASKTKTRGRLDRAVLLMLAKGLEECFDEVRKQEVPERFKLLLQQF
ncbi:MAG TPA: hypothetical protein VG145_01005 [Xanthobacteraceae bacterium]|jgi:hypothetical protein|nr:hypothetical protein [Xanthobacteraceae bacterium]